MGHAKGSACETFFNAMQKCIETFPDFDNMVVGINLDSKPAYGRQVRNAKTGCEMKAKIGFDMVCMCGAIDEKFSIKDKSKKPLVGAYYSVKMPSGEVSHDVIDFQGHTKRYHLETAGQVLEIYIGHIEKGLNNATPIVSGAANTTPQSTIEVCVDRLWKPWNISPGLVNFIAEWESGILNGVNYRGQVVTNGMILDVYTDSRNLPTVGCGHLVVAADNLTVGDTITLAKAREFLIKDLASMEKAVNSKINVPLHQYEYDALVDIAFNAGPGAGIDRLAAHLNKGHYLSTPEFIKSYRIGGGNEKRRASEAKLFERGIYDAQH